MSVTINAKGTSVPYFKLGKTGSTLYQGSSDPTGSYTVANGDVWFDTNTNLLKFRSSGSWVPQPGSGTVTTVSVVSANGLAGSVSNAGTTPAITLSTSVTGLLKGNGTAISAATSGTDYSAGTSALATGILKSTTSTGALSIAVAGDFPTLNQSTTGSAATLTTARNITATGDASWTVSFNGSADASAALTLATVNSNVGTFNNVTVNAKGLVTAASNVSYLTGNQSITVSGDASGSGTTSIPLTLATVNASPQSDTFRKITVNGKGLVTATSAVTASDITTALTYTPVNRAGDTMSGNLNLGGNLVTNLGAPSAGTDATNKNYVDAAIAGLTWKTSVRAATTANGTLATAFANGQTIDGVTLATGDRILIKNQTTQTENGIYIVAASGAPTRSTDADTGTELVGASVYVDQGTANADTGWTQTANAPITIGSTNITWVQFAGSGTYTAGTGLSLTGNTFANTGVLSLTGGTNINVSAGTGNITVSVTGTVASASTATTLANSRSITATGDASWTVNFDGSTNVSAALTLATVNSSPQTDTFRKVTVNGKGLVTATSAVTTSDITALVDSTYVNVTGDTMSGTLTLDQTGNQLSGRLIVGDQTTPASTTSIYLRSTTGSYINYSSGGNLIFNADGSGTAEKMRLDSSGNLLLGETSAGYSQAGRGLIEANGSSSALFGLRVGSTNKGYLLHTGTDMFLSNDANGNVIINTNATERMRVDSSGNVGIGGTPVASNGILQVASYASVKALLELATVTAAAPSSTTNFDLITQAVQYYTSNASTNFTLNVRGSSGTSLNTIMQTGQSATLSLLVTNGGTAFRPTAFQIDGNSVTPKWQGGTAPSAGNINSIDIYTLTIIKTASATFTVLATQTQFA